MYISVLGLRGVISIYSNFRGLSISHLRGGYMSGVISCHLGGEEAVPISSHGSHLLT